MARLDHLVTHGREKPFFELVRALEESWPEGVALGTEGPAHGEHVRLRPSVSLLHPTADVESVTPLPGRDQIQVTTTFLGLYGVDSPLPYVYPDRIARNAPDRVGERERAFLDILHHRMLSLLYRAWGRYRLKLGATIGQDQLLRRLYAFVGRDPRSEEIDLLHMPPCDAQLYAMRSRTASGLEQLLRRRLGMRTAVRQLIRRRIEIPRRQRSRLGIERVDLGRSMAVGAHLTDRNRIRLCVQLNDRDQVHALLPGGAGCDAVRDTMTRYVPRLVDYEVEVTMHAAEVNPLRLDGTHSLGHYSFLGRPHSQAVALQIHGTHVRVSEVPSMEPAAQ